MTLKTTDTPPKPLAEDSIVGMGCVGMVNLLVVELELLVAVAFDDDLTFEEEAMDDLAETGVDLMG